MATERIDIVINETGGERVVNVIINIHEAADRAEKSITLFRRGMNLLGSAVTGALGALRRLVSNLFSVRALLTTIISGYAIKQLFDYADAWQNATNKLAAFIDDADRVIAVQEELFAIARRSRSEFAATATVFQRLLLSQDSLGISTGELLEVTETLNKAVILSGASSQEASAGLIQLSQGIASGALRGEELLSVMEQLPFVAQLFADELKVTRGELRNLGTEGKITADIIINALRNAADVVDERFGRTAPTLGQSFTVLRNSFERFIGKLAQSTGLLQNTTNAILGMAKLLDDVVDILGALNTEVSDGPLNAFAGRDAGALLSQEQGSTVGEVLVSSIKELLFSDLLPAFGRIMGSTAVLLVSSIVEFLIRFTPQILVIVYTVAEAFVTAIINSIRQAAPQIADLFSLEGSTSDPASIQATLANAVGTIRAGAAADIAEDLALATGNVKAFAEGMSYLADTVRDARGEIDLLNDSVSSESSILDPKAAADFDELLRGISTEIDLVKDLSRSVAENKVILEGSELAMRAFGESSELAGQKIGELKTLVDQLESARALRALAEDIGDAFASAFEDAIFEAKSFRDVVEALVKDISRMVFQELVSKQIAQGIAGFLGGTGGTGGLLSFLGFAEGGIVDQPTFMGFSGGKPVVAGEGDRAEAVIPLGDGNTVPVQMVGRGVVEQPQNVTYKTDIHVYGVQDVRGMERSSRHIVDSMQNQLRRGHR
jgi:tape measure domain-containing protein